MNEGSFEILEQCLEATESGADIETCLSPFPEMANELRPLLEAAQIARSMRDDYVPNAALQRSRSRLLLRAASLRKQDRSKPGFGRLPRIAFAALALALLVFLTWQGLVVAAAKALPGDALYPFKLTAEDLSLKIAQDADARRNIEVKYEQRRVDEVMQLLRLGREAKVQFVGVLEKQGPQSWIVDGVPVSLTSQTQTSEDLENGMVVKVNGYSQGNGVVLADAIHLNSYELIGKVESISGRAWVISGLELQALDTSQIDPAAHVGDQVIVLVGVVESGPPQALAVLRLLQPALIETAVPQVTPTFEPGDSEMEFSGLVEEIGANSWTINGQVFQITGSTEIEENIAVGDFVSIHALVLPEGGLTATEISLEESSQSGYEDDQIEQGGGQISPTEESHADQGEELSPGTDDGQEDTGTEIKPGDDSGGDKHEDGSDDHDISPTETSSGSDETISTNDSWVKDYGDESQSGEDKVEPVEGDHEDDQSFQSQLGLIIPSGISIAFRLPYPDVF